MRLTYSAAVFAGLVSLPCAPLRAATIEATYVFDQIAYQHSVDYVSNGVSLTVSAYAYNVYLRYIEESFVRVNDYSGLGATSNDDGSDLIDGFGDTIDILEFAFAQEVELVSLSLTRIDDGDDVTYLLFDDLFDDRTITYGQAFSVPESGLLMGLGVPSASRFGIGALRDIDDFRISGLTIRTTEPETREEPLPTPLPPAGLLGLGGIGALALLHRRRRRRQVEMLEPVSPPPAKTQDS